MYIKLCVILMFIVSRVLQIPPAVCERSVLLSAVAGILWAECAESFNFVW
jgi:hypothetical protein